MMKEPTRPLYEERLLRVLRFIQRNLDGELPLEDLARKAPILLVVDEAAYLSIDGRDVPGGPESTDKIGTLHAVACTVTMTSKFDADQDYVTRRLEAACGARKAQDNCAPPPSRAVALTPRPMGAFEKSGVPFAIDTPKSENRNACQQPPYSLSEPVGERAGTACEP
ncbi:MAG: hypothetical protein JSW27_23970 [Phycisphaerales bacterium]|nr:MAG: hypothetical protein JSW27_23970 [Phycisphaerales bacterium]